MKNNFIITEKYKMPGEEAERRVWAKIVKDFSGNCCLAYWRYPMFLKVGEKRREPDILLLDQKLGVVIIEVKGLKIEQVVAIDGHRWSYVDFYEDFGNPYEQAENHLFSFLGLTDRKSTLRRRVSGRAVVALPNITRKQWQAKGFDQQLSNPPILFKDDLSGDIQQQLKTVTAVADGDPLDDGKWQDLCHVVGATSVLRVQEVPSVEKIVTKSDAINAAKERVMAMDIEQEKAAKQIPEGPQRIRGIAGSGKTVLLCQKAAAMHLKHPDWDIAMVFFTRSLYDIVIDLIGRYISHFTQGEVIYDPDTSRLRVLHAWGAKGQPGLYSEACKQHHVTKLTPSTVGHQGSPTELLVVAATKFLDQLDLQGRQLEGMFDAILIDEGQDLVVDEHLKREGRQSYYWMAYHLCKDIPVPQTSDMFDKGIKPDNKLPLRRLIWGYDEAQCIEAPVIPSAAEVFGAENSTLMMGQYQGGIKRSIVMQRCYRTPGPILVAAHAIGMGLLRGEGMISGVTNQRDWNNLGYEVEGKFLTGQQVKLWRPAENSPNPMSELSAEPSMEVAYFHSRTEEIRDTAARIVADINIQGLKPSRQILVVILGNKKFDYLDMNSDIEQLSTALRQAGINFYIPSATKVNELKPKYPNTDPNLFWYENAVTIAEVNRAKGNEAEMVYVVGLDRIASLEASISARNQLYVALTRAKGWVRLSGLQGFSLNDEVNTVIAAKGVYEFYFNKKPQRDISDIELTPEWSEVSQGLDDEFDNLVVDLFCDDVEAPTLSYELFDSARVIVQPLFSWPKRKLAITETASEKNRMEKCGWSVITKAAVLRKPSLLKNKFK